MNVRRPMKVGPAMVDPSRLLYTSQPPRPVGRGRMAAILALTLVASLLSVGTPAVPDEGQAGPTVTFGGVTAADLEPNVIAERQIGALAVTFSGGEAYLPLHLINLEVPGPVVVSIAPGESISCVPGSLYEYGDSPSSQQMLTCWATSTRTFELSLPVVGRREGPASVRAPQAADELEVTVVKRTAVNPTITADPPKEGADCDSFSFTMTANIPSAQTPLLLFIPTGTTATVNGTLVPTDNSNLIFRADGQLVKTRLSYIGQNEPPGESIIVFEKASDINPVPAGMSSASFTGDGGFSTAQYDGPMTSEQINALRMQIASQTKVSTDRTPVYVVEDDGSGTPPDPTPTATTACIPVKKPDQVANETPTALNPTIQVVEDVARRITPRELVFDAETSPENHEFELLQPDHGTITTNADGTFLYTPDPDFFGEDTLVYAAMDRGAGDDCLVESDTCQGVRTAVGFARIEVEPVIDLPYLRLEPPLLAVLEENGTMILPDFALAGLVIVDPLTTLDVGPAMVSRSTANGEFVLGTLREHPALHYHPNENWNGVDTVEFALADGEGNPITVVLELHVTPRNSAPTLVAPAERTIDEDTILFLDLRELVHDVETHVDDLTYEVVSACPDGGSCWLVEKSHLIDWQGPGQYEIHPPHNFNGTGILTFRVWDRGDPDGCLTLGIEPCDPGDTLLIDLEVTVLPVNDPPHLQEPFLELDEDTSLTIDLKQFAWDVETRPEDMTYVIGQPSHGTTILDPVTPGLVTYTPNENYAGQDLFEFSVTDTGDGDSPPLTMTSLVRLTVHPVPDAPAVSIVGPESVEGGSTVTYEFVVDDPDDGSSFTVTDLSCGSLGQPVAGSLLVTDAGGSFSCAFDTEVGQTTVSVKVTDDDELTGEASLDVRVTWRVEGFYEPVAMEGVNTVKGGSNVTLRFEVFVGSVELTDPAVVSSFDVAAVSCHDAAASPIPLAPDGKLRYDAQTGQFVQTWKTPKARDVCYVTTITTTDGSSLSALFRTT